MEMREAGSSLRGRERSKSCSTGGEGEAGIINQAEDRETRIHGFEVTMAFLREVEICLLISNAVPVSIPHRAVEKSASMRC